MQVTAYNGENLQVHMNASNHLLLADEPERDGGDDAGPSPYDLLLSSLAACKVMTVFMYARRKQWPLEKMTIGLDHHQIKASECEDCTSRPEAKVTIITCEMSFEGDLTAEQKARLGEIAEKCPVHRTLMNEIKIRAAVVETVA